MIREIEFRGLTDGEAPTWVYGSLVNNLWLYSEYAKYPKGSKVCEIITGKYEGDCWEDIAEDCGDTIVTVIPESVGQYVGLKDRNDKKIYEGDEVDYEWNDSWSGEWVSKSGVVEYKNGEYFPVPNNDSIREFEVTGNIYNHL